MRAPTARATAAGTLNGQGVRAFGADWYVLLAERQQAGQVLMRARGQLGIGSFGGRWQAVDPGRATTPTTPGRMPEAPRNSPTMPGDGY